MRKILGVTLAILCSIYGLFGFTSCQKEAKTYTRYEITCEYIPETCTLAGTVKVTFENPTDTPLEVLKFQLYPNAYRKNAVYSPISPTYEEEAFYDGESYGELSISSVRGSKNWEVMGEDENILCVYLESPLYPDENVVLDVGFMTKLAKIKHSTGVTKNAIQLGNFFPILCGIRDNAFVETVYHAIGTPFFSDVADYKVKLTLPKEFEVAFSGTLLEENTLESKKEYTMYLMNARNFAFVLYENGRKHSVQSGNTELTYYSFSDPTPKETLLKIKESFDFFEAQFGDYPYAQYTVAETELCGLGVSYPTLAFLPIKEQGGDRTTEITTLTARQWWGCTVGSDPLLNAWQDEGVAAYSALLFFERYEKYGLTREGMINHALKEYRSYFDIYGSVLGRTDTRMTRALDSYVSEYEYFCLSRYKSMIMLDTLRKSVGEEGFMHSLRRYYKDQRFQVASVGDLVASFEKSGLDVAGFFESFLEGKAII